MSILFIGQNGSEKNEIIQTVIANDSRTDHSILILDYKNEHKNYSDISFPVDYVNPALEPLSLNDIKVLNAGYEKKSHLLYKKAEEILREYQQETPFNTTPFHELHSSLRKMRLIEESIDRLSFSWGRTEPQYSLEFHERIQTKRLKKHIPPSELVDSIIEAFNEGKVVSLTRLKKSVKTYQLRAITFLLLHRIIEKHDKPLTVVSSELSTLWNKGNTKLWMETMDVENVNWITSFKKVSDTPECLLPYTKHVGLFRIEDKQESLLLAKWGNGLADVRKIPKGTCKTFVRSEGEGEILWKRTNLTSIR
ncbi:hypothetical protein [Bacillus cereus]|uniref:Uncharacterized protein n=1 Tax=Bacillus cereus TaxID=1396 RepID=A0A164P6E3_BACCE|nr:hypothetical protein [Bacillus cereus]KZD66322.1 hypothetical protein B4088_2438 [Bacillus cereus]